MNVIFDEINQYIIKKVNDKIKILNHEYWNLEHGKKYLVVYYDHNNSNNIFLLEYIDYFNDITPCYPGAYGDLSEGYSYIKSTDSNADAYSSVVISDLNSKRAEYYYEFYELENNFKLTIFEQIYKHTIYLLQQSKLNNCDICYYNSENLIIYIYINKYTKYIDYIDF